MFSFYKLRSYLYTCINRCLSKIAILTTMISVSTIILVFWIVKCRVFSYFIRDLESLQEPRLILCESYSVKSFSIWFISDILDTDQLFISCNHHLGPSVTEHAVLEIICFWVSYQSFNTSVMKIFDLSKLYLNVISYQCFLFKKHGFEQDILCRFNMFLVANIWNAWLKCLRDNVYL